MTDVERHGVPVVGFGFNSNGRYAAQGILRERFIPRLLEAAPADVANEEDTNLDPHKCWALMMAGEKPGGHGERSVACGVLDMALWDAVAKIEDKPLCAVLAERYGCKADGLPGYVAPDRPMERVWVYAAGGYYQPEKDHTKLQEEMQGYLDMGFKTVKMKIGGAPLEEDIERIKAVLEVTGGAGDSLAVDANGRFDLEEAVAYAKAMAPFNLRWYEEAGDPLDYQLQAELSKVYPASLSMATGENLFSMQDARNLIRYPPFAQPKSFPSSVLLLVCAKVGRRSDRVVGCCLRRYGGMHPGTDVLQFDPALSYGLVEYLRTIEMLESNGWSRTDCVPHGGHLFALHIAAGLGLGGNEAYPGVFQPFGGFVDGVTPEDGYVRLPTREDGCVGIGIEMKADLYAEFTPLLEREPAVPFRPSGAASAL